MLSAASPTTRRVRSPACMNSTLGCSVLRPLAAKRVNFGRMRIGVHAGYGEPITTAARLDTAKSLEANRIRTTVASAVEKFMGRPIGDLVLRGRRSISHSCGWRRALYAGGQA
jgi:hypothetical protein